jgi:DNA-binding MarR family transcriptional regulator
MESADDIRARDDREDNILRSLRKITRAIDIHSRQLAKRYELTGPQLVCLRQLRRSGTACPSDIAREISLSQATVTGIVDRLDAHGLITRRRSSSDRRRVEISLTPRGRKLVDSVPSPLQERFAERIADLPEENRELIDTVLRQIVGMMEAEQIEAAPMLQSGSLLADPHNEK